MESPDLTIPAALALERSGAAPRPWRFVRHPVFRMALLALGTASIMAIHYATPATLEHSGLHDLHRHLLYIPIVLAAFWFGWRGGLAAAVAISALFFPHLLGAMHDREQHLAMGHAQDLTAVINRVMEMVIYLVVGGVTGLLIDRLRAEEDGLRHANAELAARTAQLQEAMDALTLRTREIFEAEEQLRRADRLSAIGQMTTGLAHEIRNPLASIRGTAEILGDGALNEAHRVEFSRILLEETQRLDRVLGSFLDYARAQKTGTAQGAESHCALRDVIERLQGLLGRPLADARIELTLDVNEHLPPLAISADLLQQVLLNLSLNAIQAMGRGGRLMIEGRRESPQARRAIIRIRDTGPGIPPALAGRVFDPFFTTKTQGVGLGLSIVHKIIAGCGGQVALETGTKEGASFKITLPLAD